MLKSVLTKETFFNNFQRLTEKINVNKHLIDSFLSLESETKIGLRPPRKLIENILKCIENESKNEKERIHPLYYSLPKKKDKRKINYQDLREIKKPVAKAIKRKHTIEDHLIENYKDEKRKI